MTQTEYRYKEKNLIRAPAIAESSHEIFRRLSEVVLRHACMGTPHSIAIQNIRREVGFKKGFVAVYANPVTDGFKFIAENATQRM